MSEELKPCPFCGGPGYLCQMPSASGGDRYIWIAKCSTDDGCGVEFLGTSRKVDAIKEWNRRVYPRKHIFWNAGEPDCPKDIKARNGELHTLRCKVCGKGPTGFCESDAADLTAKLKIAVEALEHYGNPDTYSDGFHKFGCDAPNIASDALKQIGEQR